MENNLKNQITFLLEAPGSEQSKIEDNRKIAVLRQTIDQLKEDEKKELKSVNKTQLTWPASTMNGRPRTITAIRRIVNEIEESDEPLPNHVTKGIKGRSVLLDQPDFDMIGDIPSEYMHLMCLGVVKRMVELTFNVGDNRPRITNRKRSSPIMYNIRIRCILVPREFSRRCRNLDFAVFKAQEYRNIILFFFEIVVECIELEFVKERKLWLNIAYVIRACILPNEEFEKVQLNTIFKACELIYNLYEELFGERNCSYSIHVTFSHILKVRGNVPLTDRSAFMFESFFGEMKHLFQPGTNAPLKQILKNSLMKRLIEFHTCEKTIYYSVKKKEDPEKNMENNHLIYTFENDKHQFHNIVEVHEDFFICTKQGKFNYTNTLTTNYNWGNVGVYKLGPCGTETYVIERKNVSGKALIVTNLIITCPINILNEK